MHIWVEKLSIVYLIFFSIYYLWNVNLKKINQQINVYVPEITLLDTIVNSIPDEYKLFIKIVYIFNLDNTTDSIQLNFD